MRDLNKMSSPGRRKRHAILNGFNSGILYTINVLFAHLRGLLKSRMTSLANYSENKIAAINTRFITFNRISAMVENKSFFGVHESR